PIYGPASSAPSRYQRLRCGFQDTPPDLQTCLVSLELPAILASRGHTTRPRNRAERPFLENRIASVTARPSRRTPAIRGLDHPAEAAVLSQASSIASYQRHRWTPENVAQTSPEASYGLPRLE